ncbi:TIGR04104 family putative zinc finger protein [Radiobacillus deserti]|uniref:Cxxc_20_cxxc protein n=1 Tax=Radiobacillus deserti TaxID=2594883 RepID=A0A516KDD4_9BACI|nr:TIGR04104 family putative zinc finger protein [Radiobacillus deserti]QDP39415.1 hypothetical protein FN924_03945 [Radiobacillus deserti]
MPTCQQCGRQWTWQQTLRRTFTLGNKMKCPHCNQNQYISATARKRLAIFNFIGPFMIISGIASNSMIVGLGIGVVLFALAIIMYPYLVRLANHEESLW